MSVIYLPHTADIRMIVQADSVNDLFVEAVAGMNELLKPGCCRKELPWTRFRELHTMSVDYTCLLVDFLADVLALSLAHQVLFCEIRILEMNDLEIIAELYGIDIDRFDANLKAVSYREADVQIANEGHWETVITMKI